MNTPGLFDPVTVRLPPEALSCTPNADGCSCLPDQGKRGRRLADDHDRVLSGIRSLWHYKKVLPFAEFPAEAERLFHGRGRLARDIVIPHLQDTVEAIAERCHALSMLDAESASGPRSPGVVDVGELMGRQQELADMTVALLVTDQHTWTMLIETIERHGWADSHVRRILARRRKMGTISAPDPTYPHVRKAAVATVAVLEAMAVAEGPLTLTGDDRELFEHTQARIDERLDLVRTMEYKVTQARMLARHYDQLVAEQRRKRLASDTPPPRRRASKAAARRAAYRDARRAVQDLDGQVAGLVSAYTISSNELRTLGWRGLGRQLTGGVTTEDHDCPGFPKARVRALFGLLKLVRHLLAEGVEPDELAASLAVSLEAERDLRARVLDVLHEYRVVLRGDGQVIALLSQLHLNETATWLIESWSAIGWLLAESLPSEHAGLVAIIDDLAAIQPPPGEPS